MSTDLLQVTQKIDIIEENMETLAKDVFFSRVEDVGDNSIFITPPFRKGFYLPYRVGRIIVARVISSKVPYLFESTLLRYLSEQIPLWEIAKPISFNKIQLREDVRLDINIKVNLEILETGDAKKVFQTLTRDLSASGMKVVLPKELPVGTIVKINVTLGPDFMFETHGTIIHLMSPMPPLDKYFAGIKYMEVDAATKKKIIAYIFCKQAEMRRKEKEWFS